VKIAIVSPHRGDAAFALGLAVAAWLAEGHAVEVVNCFTRSEFAPYSDAGSLHANDRMSFVTAVRKREDEAWRKRYGVAKLKITDLNLKDAPMRLHCKPYEVFGRVADGSEKVVSKIRRAVEMSGATAIVLPLGLGGHVDHLSARDAAMPSNTSAVGLAFYEEQPYAAHCEEGAVKDALRELPLMLQTELQAMFVGRAGAVEGAVDQKRRIGWCYDSQMDEGVTTEIAEYCRRYDGRERVWVNAAWRADESSMPRSGALE
jgi:LmbE family N-acetylglucosaminyl deacetylase